MPEVRLATATAVRPRPREGKMAEIRGSNGVRSLRKSGTWLSAIPSCRLQQFSEVMMTE